MAATNIEPISEECSIVLLGAFNPAILHPEWFVRNNLVGEGALSTAELKIVSRDVTEFTLKSIRLFCDDTRFYVGITNMAHVDTLFDLAKGTLRLLSHLPIHAVGINNDAVFKVDTVEHWHRIGHALAPKQQVWDKVCTSPGMMLLSILSPVDWEHPLVEHITVQPIPHKNPNHPGLTLKINRHFQIPKNNSEQPGMTRTEYALKYIEEMSDKVVTRAKEVAHVIFREIP